MTKETTGLSKAVRAGGIIRRKQIFEATLRVILRDGVRGVRHRAVALEAQVPLASTTYYFKDLEELLTETFLFWNYGASIYADHFGDSIDDYLEKFSSTALQQQVFREKLSDIFSGLAILYVTNQITHHRNDRLIELAFHHEAVRSDKLRKAVERGLDRQLESLETFYQLIGSKNPAADSQMTISVLHRLEHNALMKGVEIDRDKIEETIRRHTRVMFLAADQDQA